MTNNNIPHGRIKFSFITDNPHTHHLDITRHGSEWITMEQYNSIMNIMYGK